MKPILENIRLGRYQSIFAFRYCDQYFDMPWHFHPQHELTYIEESIGTKFIGDYVGSYQPGELVLLRSNLPHCWKNQFHASMQAISYVIQWNDAVCPIIPELEPVFSMLKEASRGLLFSKEDSNRLIPDIKKLVTLEGPELYLSFLSILLALTTCNHQSLSEARFMVNLPSGYSSRMSLIHDFIETNFNRKIYLSELAELTNMSESSFSRFFSKMMGRPFFTFLNEYRVNVASRMLIDTDLSVAEIGYNCGYESLPFYYKQFNKFQGKSPAKYRKQYSRGKSF